VLAIEIEFIKSSTKNNYPDLLLFTLTTFQTLIFFNFK